MKYNTNSICSQFYDYKFWHARWDNLYFSSLSPKSRLASPNNIFFKEAMATNIALQALKKNIRSLSRRSCQASTIPKRRVHGMETRSMAKAATMVVVRQIATPPPKQQDLYLKKKCLVGWTEPKAPQNRGA